MIINSNIRTKDSCAVTFLPKKNISWNLPLTYNMNSTYVNYPKWEKKRVNDSSTVPSYTVSAVLQ